MWIPKYKYQLVDALALIYPDDRKRYERMSKTRLYAIYFEVRRKRELVSSKIEDMRKGG